jgi:hypothetical protein
MLGIKDYQIGLSENPHKTDFWLISLQKKTIVIWYINYINILCFFYVKKWLLFRWLKKNKIFK